MIPATMRAQRLHVPTRTMTVEEVPVPTPGPGQVLIDVAYCGICHSDLGLLEGTFTDPRGPETITQGHEASGTIAAVGEGVTGWAVGDRVVPAAGRPCRRCDRCRRGDLTNCDDVLLMAFAYDGAWAEFTLAEAGGLTRVPDGVPLDQAALLADAVSTPFGAVVHTAAVQPGEAVGVWGVGGVGTHLVQLARLVGAVPVVAVDLDPAVRERALAVGADLALDPADPDLRQEIAEATDGHLLDVAFDAVGLKTTFEQGLAMLAPARSRRRCRAVRPGDLPRHVPGVQPVPQEGPRSPRLQELRHRDARAARRRRPARPVPVRQRRRAAGGRAGGDPPVARAGREPGAGARAALNRDTVAAERAMKLKAQRGRVDDPPCSAPGGPVAPLAAVPPSSC